MQKDRAVALQPQNGPDRGPTSARVLQPLAQLRQKSLKLDIFRGSLKLFFRKVCYRRHYRGLASRGNASRGFIELRTPVATKKLSSAGPSRAIQATFFGGDEPRIRGS